jgi:glutathione synthase/RimK-type ligase-like ATP-grasp enzyme
MEPELFKHRYQHGILPHGIKNVVNWGCYNWSVRGKVRVLNPGHAVVVGANKLATFRQMDTCKIPTLEWTTEHDKAREWIKSTSVVCHTDLHAHSGRGLVLARKGDSTVPVAKLYTRYFPKTIESRVHVVKSLSQGYRAFYLQKKRVLEDRYEEFNLEDTPDTFIRTHDRGWVFARNVIRDEQAVELGIRAAKAAGLDYGAVDIMINKKGDMKVGELNTAPGLEGQCLAFYVNGIKDLMVN